MNKIFVARGSNQLGQFFPQEVADGLQSGRFLPSDLAWKEGMGTWITLATFPDLPPASSTPQIVTASGEPASEETPLQSMDQPSADHPDIPGLPQPAWERRAELGILSAAVQTVKQVLLSPAATFSSLPREGGIFGPLMFSVILGWIGSIFALVYQLIGLVANPAALGSEGVPAESGFVIGALVVFGFLAPIFLLISLFIGAGILHLLLMLMGGVSRPFESTLRVLAYVQGATMLLQIVPLCGGFISSIWYIYSAAHGLARVHQTQPWRVVVAILIPVVLLCGLAVVLALMIPAIAGAAALEGAG